MYQPPNPKGLAAMAKRYSVANDLVSQRLRCRAASEQTPAPELRTALYLWRQRMSALLPGAAVAVLTVACSGAPFERGYSDAEFQDASMQAPSGNDSSSFDSDEQGATDTDEATEAPTDILPTADVDTRADGGVGAAETGYAPGMRPIDPPPGPQGSVTARPIDPPPDPAMASSFGPETDVPDAATAAPPSSFEAAPQDSAPEADAMACEALPDNMACLKAAISSCAEKGGIKLYCSGNPLSNTCYCSWEGGGTDLGRGLECGRSEVDYSIPANLCQ